MIPVSMQSLPPPHHSPSELMMEQKDDLGKDQVMLLCMFMDFLVRDLKKSICFMDTVILGFSIIGSQV